MLLWKNQLSNPATTLSYMDSREWVIHFVTLVLLSDITSCLMKPLHSLFQLNSNTFCSLNIEHNLSCREFEAYFFFFFLVRKFISTFFTWLLDIHLSSVSLISSKKALFLHSLLHLALLETTVTDRIMYQPDSLQGRTWCPDAGALSAGSLQMTPSGSR